MSAEAQVRLQKLWEKLSFHKVSRTIARQPEDVLSINIDRPDGWQSRHTTYKRVADVPEYDRPFASVSWRHYFGFTADNVYFQKDDYHGLDLDISLTMTWSKWGNHTGGYRLPEEGSWVYGEVIDTPRGKRLTKWAYCSEAFKLLVEAVRGEVNLSEDELGRRLLVGDYPDKLWAIARLVLFDNVQAFVDNAKPRERLEAEGVGSHPATGMIYGDHGFTVDHLGMSLHGGAAEYVHLISYQLQEPKWWDSFLQLADAQDVQHSHPAYGGWCKACEHEMIRAGGYRDSAGDFTVSLPYYQRSLFGF